MLSFHSVERFFALRKITANKCQTAWRHNTALVTCFWPDRVKIIIHFFVRPTFIIFTLSYARTAAKVILFMSQLGLKKQLTLLSQQEQYFSTEHFTSSFKVSFLDNFIGTYKLAIRCICQFISTTALTLQII